MPQALHKGLILGNAKVYIYSEKNKSKTVVDIVQEGSANCICKIINNMYNINLRKTAVKRYNTENYIDNKDARPISKL